MTAEQTKEVTDLNMPGFTAEASLYRVSNGYRKRRNTYQHQDAIYPAGVDFEAFCVAGHCCIDIELWDNSTGDNIWEWHRCWHLG
jgi:hypothetical protein